MVDKVLSEEAKNDPQYMAYLEACQKNDPKVDYEDLDSNQMPRSYEHFYREDASLEFKNKWHKRVETPAEELIDPSLKVLEGEMKYRITLTKDDIDLQFQQSNENNLASFIAVQKMYDELYDLQMQPGSPQDKMSKAELKELQVARQYLKKHISVLGKYAHDKYINAIVTKDKPKIQIVSPIFDGIKLPSAEEIKKALKK